MNSLERIIAAINFKKPERQPVIGQVFGHAAAVCNVGLKDYVQNGELLAECQIKTFKRYRYDAVFAVMDANVEAEAAGSILEYSSNLYPFVKHHILAEDPNVKNLQVPDPTSSGRMPEQLKAVKILRQELEDNALVVGCVLGPMTLTGQLLGLKKALYLAVDQPEVFEDVLEYSTNVAIEFGAAQLKAGAHLPMVFDPTASPAVVPPAFFREIIVPKLNKIFNKFKAMGSLTNYLHIAGPTSPILKYYQGADVELANIDYYVSYDDIKIYLPDICVCGNIKCSLFLEETTENIRLQSKSILKSFQEREGFILSSGCEIPLETNPNNIQAMIEVAHKG